MINIQFINATSVQLRTVGSPKQIEYTINGASQGGPLFSCSNNFFSKDDSNYYYFAISGQNVQLSGQITQVTEDYQFFNLFRDQPAIVDASNLQLQANSVKKFAYANMFLDCTNLRRNPPIAARYLDQWCFASMFGNCSSLTHAKDITAIQDHVTLKPYCFYCMFYNCKSLVGTGENSSQFYFGAYELTDWCCNSMFYGCKSLSSIWCQFNQWSPANATTNWVKGVAQSGWFNNDWNIPQVYGIDNIPSGWSLEQPQPPAPDPTISIASIPDLVWDFETNTTSSVNLTSYITYSNGTGTITYDLGGTLANGVVFNNGILSANKDLMENDFSQNFTLSASATDITSTATEDFSLTISGVYQQPPVPVPTITIATIPAISWDFEEATTSSVNLAQYVTYDGSSTLNYSIAETLPSGVVFENGVLSANKSQMSDDLNTTLTLSAYASDAEPATKQFSFAVANVEEPEPPVPVGDSLTFTAKSPSNISLQKVGSPSSITLQYNKNNTGWNDYTIGNVINLATNDTVAFSGANDHFSFYNTQDGSEHYYNFQMNGTIEANGNIMSLMNFSNSCDSACFFLLFAQCSSLVKAPTLPASTLADYCYMGMFRGTSITTPPVLSATTLTVCCYNSMFARCSQLTSAPELPAAEMVEGCYGYMFSLCLALSTAPVLSATTLGYYCYQGMFNNCWHLSSAPTLPATTLASDCYSDMFEKCYSLTEAPTLPATSLAYGCYDSMFYDCTNLSSIEVAFTSWNSGRSTRNWLYNTANNGTFTKPTALPNLTSGDTYIPLGWTVVNK